eukprot:GHRR01002436.1.p1 GENE.GHRR01002436.1~~GHRR01002436.1.p1  ORF type:complete len:478 (+),score=184.33 GHRR01002436.1:327-1760(+)
MDPLFGGDNYARHGSLPPGPPPPYESVITDAASHNILSVPPDQSVTGDPASSGSQGTAAAANGSGGRAAGLPSPAYNSDFEIVVADPVKQGEGVSAFVSYKVRTRTRLPQYNRPTSEVIRRFRDFVHLEQQLSEKHKGVIIPPLPEKNAVQKFQMSQEFIEERRRALQVFLNRAAAHPALATSPELQLFLEATEDTWAVEMARAQQAAGSSGGASGPKERLKDAVGWFKGLGQAATSIVAGSNKAADSAEDPEYIKVRDYLVALESHLAEAHRQAARLTSKEAELGEATLEFGQALERLGRLEEGNVSEAFSQFSSRASELVAARRKGCEALGAKFEAPLKEAVRTVRSVTAVCNDRALALSAHLAAKQDVDAKKVKWARLRGTPGSPPEKLAEAEKEVSDAEGRLRETKIAYEELVAVMTEELNRWQKDRAADMSALLRDFALAQASMASEGVRAWSGLLAELQAVTGAPAAAAIT